MGLKECSIPGKEANSPSYGVLLGLGLAGRILPLGESLEKRADGGFDGGLFAVTDNSGHFLSVYPSGRRGTGSVFRSVDFPGRSKDH